MALADKRDGIGRAEWRVILLSSLGGALEFYDFVIYSLFARYIGATFFPAHDPLVSLMLSYAVFAVGYLVRPIGGVILSHFGDRYGRRRVFIGTIVTISLTTLAMGLLPGYAAWGIGASIAMILLRIIQGFCLGGELPGAITYVVETAPRHAGLAATFVFACVNTGVLLAALLSLVLHEFLGADEIAAWGWRIGFLVGAAFGLLSFFMRRYLEETREFARIKDQAAALPVAELVRTHPAAILVGIAALAASAGVNGLIFAMPAIFPQIMDYSATEVLVAQNVMLAVTSIGMIVVAWFGDRFPRRWFLRAGTALTMLLAYGWFAAASDRTMPLWLLGVAAALVISLSHGVFAGIVADLFPTRIRFTGIAVSFNLAFSLFSGIAPLAATALVAATGAATGAAFFMIGLAALSFIASFFVHGYEGQIGRTMDAG
jgi:MFS family permease